MAFDTIGLGTAANDGTGDDLRTAGGKINTNFGKAIENTKLIIPAAAMLPLTADSAYYLESDVFPAQVFSDTVTQSVKLQLFDIGNQIPAAANAFKVKVCGRRTQEVVSDDEVCWRAKAAWVRVEDLAVTLGDPVYVVDTYDAQNKIFLSDATADCTPSGSRSAGCELRIEIARDIAYEVESAVVDTLNAPAHLVWIEIEFTTVG
jgi:hypothetical protein